MSYVYGHNIHNFSTKYERNLYVLLRLYIAQQYAFSTNIFWLKIKI